MSTFGSLMLTYLVACKQDFNDTVDNRRKQLDVLGCHKDITHYCQSKKGLSFNSFDVHKVIIQKKTKLLFALFHYM